MCQCIVLWQVCVSGCALQNRYTWNDIWTLSSHYHHFEQGDVGLCKYTQTRISTMVFHSTARATEDLRRHFAMSLVSLSVLSSNWFSICMWNFIILFFSWQTCIHMAVKLSWSIKVVIRGVTQARGGGCGGAFSKKKTDAICMQCLHKHIDIQDVFRRWGWF